MTSVAAVTPCRHEHLGRGPVERAHLIDRRGEVGRIRPTLARAAHQQTRSESLGQHENVAGRAPPLRSSRSGWAAPMTARPYLGSGSRIVCPPASVPPASRTLSDAPPKTCGQDVARQLLGERRDRQREEDAATHREHVAHAFAAAISPNVRASSTSGGKKSSVPMIARSSLIRYAAASSGGLRPAISSSGARLGAQPGERIRQQVGTELRGAAATVGQRREAQGRDVGQGRHRSMIGVLGWRVPVSRPRLPSSAGAVGPRWVPRSSKPVTPRSAWRGGFDSHAFPPWRIDVVEAGRPPASAQRRERPEGIASAPRRDRSMTPMSPVLSPPSHARRSMTSAPASVRAASAVGRGAGRRRGRTA